MRMCESLDYHSQLSELDYPGVTRRHSTPAFLLKPRALSCDIAEIRKRTGGRILQCLCVDAIEVLR